MQQENIDAIRSLLDRWANWVGIGGNICNGAPRQSAVAPDARVQSIEDLEIEDEKLIVRAVNTAVYDLMKPQRDVVMVHYGFINTAWTQTHDAVFDIALTSLYYSLKQRVCV